jgi:predicted DCC family thiol-disulfide oxidoreductase YuxK
VPVVRFTVKGQGDDSSPALAPTYGSPARAYTVIYDGACRICQGLVRRLGKWDERGLLEIVPSQGAGVGARVPGVAAGGIAEAGELNRGIDRHTRAGGAANEQIIDRLPKGKLVTWVFSIPFVRPLAERFYRWFARNRYRLGCGEHCQFRALDLQFEDERVASR